MRKYLLILILIITGVLCFSLIIGGFEIGNLKLIKSYNDVQKMSLEKKELITELKQKNDADFGAKSAALSSAVQEYKNKKAQYEKLVEEGQIKEEEVTSLDLYDVGFLWTTIGMHATKEGVTLQFDVSKSATATTVISSEYVMCDLNFTVTGEYINIANFINSLENDDKLKFEIRDFILEKGGENLQATFVVKDIPINSKTLSSVPTTSLSGYTDVITGN